MSDYKVLMVDDDPELLKSFQRRFRGRFDMDIATSGEEGLRAISANDTYPVIISDYRMPEMDGIEFLNRVRDVTPDSVRIMLTGQADLDTAIKSVNEGHVFRFLTKPCPPEILTKAINDGIKYFELVETERAFQGLEKWRKIMEEMVSAFIALMETRDPYTAGHQQKVAILACAIGKKLGLDTAQIEAIRLAATVHDIGKISVPAEYLNKPGRLTDAEFNIIKAHPQVGYDILKTIEFEYPVARIVHQHHEKMDGSGYPMGLTGAETLLEAKIIAVADVVEAMNAHRPYRPSLGIEAALEEIESKKGLKYDPDASTACIKLFQENGFVLEA